MSETWGFPLIPGTLLPAVTWSQRATWRPISTFAPGETFGLPCGPENRVFVVDVDEKQGKSGSASLAAYTEERGCQLPATFTVGTRSGGRHLYFLWDPERPVRNRGGVLRGVDVRGAGGYVRAGGVYQPIDPRTPVATMPEWLFDLVKRKESPSGNLAPGAAPAIPITPEHPAWNERLTKAIEFLASEPPCVAGQGGQGQLWKISLHLMRRWELPLEIAMRLIQTYNARCLPPWEPRDLDRHLQRAAALGTTPLGDMDASTWAALGFGAPGSPAPACKSAFRIAPFAREDRARRGW